MVLRTPLLRNARLTSSSNNKMGATRHSNGQYSIQCEARNHLPDVSFTLAGHNFSIGPEDYVFQYEGHCISAFFSNDYPPPGGPFAVIGRVFLRKWYSVFDLGTNTISLAKAEQESNGAAPRTRVHPTPRSHMENAAGI
jgi:hypothetical protein